MKYLSLTGLTTYDTKIKEYITNGLNGKTDKADVGYIELTSSSESVTDAQLAEALKKYCIIKYTFGPEEYIYYKLDENSTRIRFGREIKTVTYISYSELFQPSLEISKNTKSVQASNIFGISLYNKSQDDALLNSKLSANQVAVIEDSTTASKAYAVGDLLVYNGTLYKVTSAISSGGTIIVGTNVAAITIEELLSDKQDKSNIRTSWQSTPDNTHYPSEKLVKDNLDNKSDKSATVSTVSYDTTNKKLTKTINGTTTDVVSIATLKSDIDSLNDKYVRYDTNAQGLNNTQKANAKTNLDLNNVVNTGDSDTPVENGTDKFTTGGAYALKTTLDGEISDVNTGLNSHINNTSNPHNVTKAQVGLGNVDNTSDANKPISTDTQNALNLKEDKSNKVTSFQSTPDNTHYPSEKLVKDSLDTKQTKANLVNAWQSTPDNTHYPSEKLVYDTNEENMYGSYLSSDTTVSYIKTVPSNAKTMTIDYIYGASEVSENLIPITNETISRSSITFTFVNGVCNSSGTPSQTGWIIVKEITLNAGSYAFKDLTSGTTKFGLVNASYQAFGSTFILNETSTIYLAVTGNALNTAQLVNSKPMLVKGSTAPTEFKPYFDGIHNLELSGLKVEGKQLLDIPNVASTTIEGMTYSITGGEVSISGTPTGIYKTCYSKMITDIMSPNTTYTLNSNSNCICYAQISITNMDNTITRHYSVGTTPSTFTLPSQYKSVWFNIQNGGTASLITNGSVKPVIVRGSTSSTDFVPYIAPTTLPIDLTSIEDSGGNKLFADGSIKGVGNVADEITPSKAVKKINVVDLGTLNWFKDISYNNWLSDTNSIPLAKSQMNCLCSKYPVVQNPENVDYGCRVSGQLNRIVVHDKDTLSMTASEFKSYVSSVMFIYELAESIEADIDWRGKLYRQHCESNGTVTLVNTYNMDTSNEILFYSGEGVVPRLNSLSSGLIGLHEEIVDLDEKKQDKLSTQTAYSAKGTAIKVPQITTNTLGQVTKIEEKTITCVRYDANQSLDNTEKQQARSNIGAGTSNLTLAGNGSASTASRSDHNHNDVYLGINAKASDSAKLDGHTVEPTGVDSNTTTLPTTAQVKRYVDNYIPLKTNGGIGAKAGDGTYWYCKIATIVVTNAYINRPIIFEITGRGKLFVRLTVMFNSTNTTDPGLNAFMVTKHKDCFFIKKIDTSTWCIYGMYNEVYGSLTIHRIMGAGYNSGNTVTINMTNLSELPADTTMASQEFAFLSDIPTSSTVSDWGFTKNTGTVTSVATSGTGLSGGTITTSGTITLDSSSAGNAATNKVVLRNANGSIQTEKLAISSGTTTKATMQYNTTDDCIDFIFS